MITHLSLIGPMGIGKSTLIDQLEKEGFKVVRDPVLDIVESNQGLDPVALQTKIINALYKQRYDHRNENVIFDTSPLMSATYLMAQAFVDQINLLDTSKLLDVYEALRAEYMSKIGTTINNIEYILTDKNKSNVKNVIDRGRSWEQGNPALKVFDEGLSAIETGPESLFEMAMPVKIMHETNYSWRDAKKVDYTLFMIRKLITHEKEN